MGKLYGNFLLFLNCPSKPEDLLFIFSYIDANIYALCTVEISKEETHHTKYIFHHQYYGRQFIFIKLSTLHELSQDPYY